MSEETRVEHSYSERVEVPNPEATGLVLMRVGDERERQTAKIAAGKIPWDCADRDVPSSAKLAVLVEEVGEVANALIEDKHVSLIYAELIQVAAVAAAWAESLLGPEDADRIEEEDYRS